MLVGLCGRARAGKSTAANALVQRFGFEELSFAHPLRAFVRDILSIDDVQTFDQIKDKQHSLLGGKTPRHALQTLGTEWGRNMISDTLWIDVCMYKTKHLLAQGKNVVISDVRFDNEAERIREEGGLIIKIMRPDGPHIDSAHISELGIQHALVDVFVMNEHSEEDFLHRFLHEVQQLKKKQPLHAP